jgi:hypothetical protein
MTSDFIKYMFSKLGTNKEEMNFKFGVLNRLPKIQAVKFLYENRSMIEEEEKKNGEEDCQLPPENNLFLIQYFSNFVLMKVFDDEKNYKNQVENQENTSQSIFIPFEWFSKNYLLKFSHFDVKTNNVSHFLNQNYGSVINYTFKKPHQNKNKK